MVSPGDSRGYPEVLVLGVHFEGTAEIRGTRIRKKGTEKHYLGSIPSLYCILS